MPTMPGTGPPPSGPPERSASGPRPRTRIGPRPINPASTCAAGGRDRLGGIEAPERSTWDELAARRWGPGLTDPAPGIVFDRPVRPAFRPGPADDFDRQERAAIMEFDGGLTREAAERAAGLVLRT